MNSIGTQRKASRVWFALPAFALMSLGCAGENLFSLAGSVSDSGPAVAISVPSAGFTIALGDSVQVTANVSAPEGAASVSYSGVYSSGGGAAFTAETQTLANETATTVTNYLAAAAGQTAGEAYLYVQVFDTSGESGIDSVRVTISN